MGADPAEERSPRQEQEDIWARGGGGPRPRSSRQVQVCGFNSALRPAPRAPHQPRVEGRPSPHPWPGPRAGRRLRAGGGRSWPAARLGGGTAGGAGPAGRGQRRAWATWGRAPRKSARPSISYQSPAAHCVFLNKTNPFGGVTSTKNAAVFRTTRANMFFRFGFYGRIKVYFP